MYLCDRDASCVKEGDRCHFSLVRALVGYRVALPFDIAAKLLPVKARADNFIEEMELRMNKGELVDVSIPYKVRRERVLRNRLWNRKCFALSNCFWISRKNS